MGEKLPVFSSKDFILAPLETAINLRWLFYFKFSNGASRKAAWF